MIHSYGSGNMYVVIKKINPGLPITNDKAKGILKTTQCWEHQKGQCRKPLH